MSARHSRSLLLIIPPVITVVLIQEAAGAAQTMVAVVAAIVTTALIHLAARFVWSPLFQGVGFWWSSCLLGLAIVGFGVAAAIAGLNLQIPTGAMRLPLSASMVLLLFSWTLAALRGAEEKKA